MSRGRMGSERSVSLSFASNSWLFAVKMVKIKSMRKVRNARDAKYAQPLSPPPRKVPSIQNMPANRPMNTTAQ